MTARDTQRAKVYAAEEFVRTLFDRAAEHGNRSVDFFGTKLTLPPEGRFASVQAVQRYVDDVLAHPGVRQRWPAAGPLTVRARRGATAAHYERTADERSTPIGADERSTPVGADERSDPVGADERSTPVGTADGATIAVPDQRTSWALRELVALHEIAHHLSVAEPPHGPDFMATLCDLADAVMGPEVGYVLRVVYAKEGVR